MKLRLGCFLILIVLVLPPAIAARVLPWWGVPLFVAAEIAALVFLGPKLGKWAFKRFLFGLISMKSRVLRNAKVEVHDVRRSTRPIRRARSIEPADDATRRDETTSPPIGDDANLAILDAAAEPADEPDEADRIYWQIDFTLRPKPGQSRMMFFDADELMLMPFDAKVRLDEDPTSDGKTGDACQVFVHEGGAWVSPEGKLPGVDQRLRVIFRCPPTLIGRAKFRYYFEAFGDVALPS